MMRTEVHDEELIIVLSGEIDATTAYQPYEETVAQFERQRITSVIVDLADVTFADSTALGMLVRIKEHAEAAGAECWLQHIPENLATLLQMTGLAGTLRAR